MPSEPVLYTTTDDERAARDAVELLRLRGRRAIVERVREMALRGDPLAPHTADRFAVLAERARKLDA